MHGRGRRSSKGAAMRDSRPAGFPPLAARSWSAALRQRPYSAGAAAAAVAAVILTLIAPPRSEEHTSELQSLMRISYAVFCFKKKNLYQQPPPQPFRTSCTIVTNI